MPSRVLHVTHENLVLMVPQLSRNLSDDVGGNICRGALIQHLPLFLVFLFLLFVATTIEFRMVPWLVEDVKLIGSYVFTLPRVTLLPRREYASAFPWDGIGVVHPELIYFKDILHKSLLVLAREHLRRNKALELWHDASFALSPRVVTSETRREISILATYHRVVIHHLEIRSRHKEHIRTCIGVLSVVLHREAVDWVALLPRSRVDALFFVIDDMTVYYQYSSLSVIVLVCFCYFEFFVHVS